MKNFITIIIIISLTFIFGCEANLSNRVFNIDPNKESTNIKGPLWKVEDDNNTVYLYGTIHNANKDIYPLHDDIEEAFNNSDILVVEQDFSDERLDRNELKSLLYYENGDTMENHLTEKALNIVKKYSKTIQGGYKEAIKLKPFAYARSMEDILSKSDKFDSSFGVDNYFLQKAQILNKEIISLDNTLKLYEDLGKLSDKYSNEIILNLDNITEESGVESLEMWKTASIENLELSLDTSLKEYNDIVLYKRNEEWIEKVIKYINDDKDYFVSVGSYHLVGENSLVYLLEKRGFKVLFLSN